MAAAHDRNNNAIVCIGAGEGQLPIIMTAKDMGLSVIAVDRNKDSIGFQYADCCIAESTHNTASVLSALRSQEHLYAVKGIVSRTTAAEALVTAYAIADAYGLPRLSIELIKTATEKSCLREFCSINNIPFPSGVKANSAAIAENIGFPVIVKPDITGTGKAGIVLCFNKAELEDNLLNTLKVSGSNYAEIESYIEGIDVSCLCFADKGHINYIAWWDEIVGIDFNKNALAAGISIPSVIEGTSAKQQAAAAGKRLMKRFKGVCALMLLSFRINASGKPYLIEIHADLGGDYIAEALLPAANPKFNFFKLAIDVAMGKGIESFPIFFKPTLVCYSNSDDSEKTAYKIVQEDSVKNNLSFIQERYSNRFMIQPSHLKWLLNSESLKNEK